MGDFSPEDFAEDGGKAVVVDDGGMPKVIGENSLRKNDTVVSEQSAKQMYKDIDTYKTMSPAERYYRGVTSEVSLGMAPFAIQKALEAGDALTNGQFGLGEWNKSRELAMERAGTGDAEGIGHGLGLAASAMIPVEEAVQGGRIALKGLGIAEKLGLREAVDVSAELAAREGVGIAERALGEAITADAAASLGRGESLNRIVNAGLGNGAHGAIYSAGNYVSDATLHDKPLTAAALAAHTGGGFFLGAGLGIGGRLAAEGLESVGEKLSTKFANEVEEKLAKKLNVPKEYESIAAKEFSGIDNKFDVVAKAKENIAQAKNELVSALGSSDVKITKARIVGAIREAEAGESAVFAPRPRDMSSFTTPKRMPGEARAPRSFTGGDGWVPGPTPTVPAPAAEAGKISGLASRLERANMPETLDGERVLKIYNMAKSDAVRAAIATEIDSVGSSEAVRAAMLKRSMNESILDAAKAGELFKKQPAAAAGGISEALSDMAYATAIGAATNPIAGALGYSAARAARYVLNGPHVKEAMERMAISGELAAMTKSTAEIAGKAATAFLTTGGKVATKQHHMETPTPASYKKILKEYDRVSSPSYREALTKYVGRLSPSPELHKSVMANYDKSVAMVGERISAANSAKLGSMRKSYQSSVLTRDQLNAVRTWNIVSNPTAAIKALMSGALSKDEANTFKTIWKDLHRQIVNSVRDSVAKVQMSGNGIHASKLVELSLLLGEPVDRVMEPEFIKRNQEAYAEAAAAKEQEESQSSSPAGKAGITESPYATPTQSDQ